MAKRSKKNIMRDFRIDEISAVDRPAQQGAQFLLMKRDSRSTKDFDGDDDGDLVILLTSADEGHVHAVWIRCGARGGDTSYAQSPDEQSGHSHPWVMDSQGNITIGMNDGHEHTVDSSQFMQALMAAAASEVAQEVAEIVGATQFTVDVREAAVGKGQAMADGSFPIIDEDDLALAIEAYPLARKRDDAARHIAKRAEDLDAEDLLPEDGALAMKLADLYIYKGDYTADERKTMAQNGEAMPDGSYPIKNRKDLKDAISSFGRGKNKPAVARHIARRARALGMTDELPDTGALASSVGKATASNPAADDGGDGLEEETDMTTKTEKSADEQKAALEKQLAKATSYGELTDSQKAHYATLDEAGQDAFLAKSKEEREKIVADIAKNREDTNPVVYKAKDGTEYRKNDDPRMVALAKRADANEERAMEAQKKADDADLRKRAETDLGHLPGTVESRMAMLKAVDGIPDAEERKKAHEALKAQNASMSKAFETLGHRGGRTEDASSPSSQLETLAKAYAEKHNVSEAEAESEVLKTDEGRKLYAQMTGDDKISQMVH